MVKRYEMRTYEPGFIDEYQAVDGDWVSHDDYQAMRRRLVAKALRNRILFLQLREWECGHFDDWDSAVRWREWVEVYQGLLDAIESGEPLGYFRKLGGDK